MRVKVSYEEIIKEVAEGSREILNLPEDVIELLILRYLKTKSELLQSGKIVSEPIGDSMITARRTNSERNGGYSAKITTALSPEINHLLCSEFIDNPAKFEEYRG